jgi:hypothetical protein
MAGPGSELRLAELCCCCSSTASRVDLGCSLGGGDASASAYAAKNLGMDVDGQITGEQPVITGCSRDTDDACSCCCCLFACDMVGDKTGDDEGTGDGGDVAHGQCDKASSVSSCELGVRAADPAT